MKQSNQPILFLHGGPGLHSQAEAHLLMERFEQAGLQLFCWNEPRPETTPTFSGIDTFKNSVESVKAELRPLFLKYGKIHLIGHSFATALILYLAQTCSDWIESIILITPCFNIPEADSRIIHLALQDFQKTHSPLADQLQSLIPQVGPEFDSAKAKALELALQDEHLFLHYWSDHQLMGQYFSFYQNQPWQFSLETFFAIRKSLLPLEGLTTSIKTLCLFGEDDPIVPPEIVKKETKNYFLNADFRTFANVRHFLHFERQVEFMNEVTNFIP